MATETKKKVAPAKAKPTKVTAPAVKVEDVRHRRTMVGTVLSNKMQKTIVIEVDRQVRHGLYSKYVGKSKKYKAHDETNDAKVGDLVSVVESRPLSREKRFVLREIIRRAEA